VIGGFIAIGLARQSIEGYSASNIRLYNSQLSLHCSLQYFIILTILLPVRYISKLSYSDMFKIAEIA